MAIRYHSMLGQTAGNVCNLFHKVMAYSVPLIFNRCVMAELYGFSEVYLSQLRRYIHGDEGKLFSGLSVIKSGCIHKLCLEVAENVVIVTVVLRENNYVFPLLQGSYGIAEGT